VDSHPAAKQVRAIWYNNRLFGGTRNESRLTNFGGGGSALLDSVEPGRWKIWTVDQREQPPAAPHPRTSCWLEPHEIPQTWMTQFPSGAEIIRKTVELRPGHGIPVDLRLMKRRDEN
jgi:Restriction endonuclease EcoRII, N-terminal